MRAQKLRSLALACLTFAPASALACGGFFCSQAPVDQQAERIVFKQVDENTVESYVEIQYQGDPEGFAWVVPVPQGYLPDQTTTFPSTVFNALDLATEPVWQLPEQCGFNGRGFPSAAGADAGLAESEPSPPPVVVIDDREVGDYRVTTVSSSSSEALVEWLRTNDYRVVPAMEPFIALYVGQQLNFVACKLLPGRGIDSIKPLKMVYRDAEPMVPLRLSSLAAMPEMGVKVFVLGSERYTVKGQPELEVDLSDMRYDLWSGQSNYSAVVARTIDAANGQGMVVDFAGPAAPIAEALSGGFAPQVEPGAEDPQALANQLLSGVGYITRFYGRYSPEEMSQDILFARDAARPDVARERQLTVDQVPGCAEGGLPDASVAASCDFATCGQGGYCVTAPVYASGDDGSTTATGGGSAEAVPGTGTRSSPQVAAGSGAGCACVDGSTARAVPDLSAPNGVRTSCVDARMNFPNLQPGDLSLPQFNGVPALPSACQGDPCGSNGACLDLNGSQTCQCNRGFVAVGSTDANGKLSVTCVAPTEEVPASFYRRSLPEPGLPFPGKGTRQGALSNDGCSVGVPGAAGGFAALGLVALAAGIPALRRRRR
jgi:hypothetical protein